jgi:hypothetical protein
VLFKLSVCFPWFFVFVCLIPFSLLPIYSVPTVWHILDISRFLTSGDGVRSQGSSYGFRMERSALDEIICENCCIRLPVSILLLRHIQTRLSARHFVD